MSDDEGSSSPIEEKLDEDVASATVTGRKRDDEDVAQDDKEDDDEDEDEEEDEEDEESDGERHKKRRKKPKTARNRFIDLEAVVDDDDEEAEEDDDYDDVANFIEEAPEAGRQDDTQHIRMNRNINRQEEQSVEDIVKKIKERHGRQAAARYNGDSDAVPQRLLMPGVNDPNLWQVRVKVSSISRMCDASLTDRQTGREQAICASIFRRCFSTQYSANPLEIISVFFRDSLQGLIFLEARQSASVRKACEGIVGIYLSREITLVPIEEMAPLLRIKKKEVSLVPGMWVRHRRGKYTGDLAQVVDVDQLTSGVVAIKYLPRIDLTPKDRNREKGLNGKATTKPPARLFQPAEIKKAYGRGSVRTGNQGNFFFDNEEFIDGFCIKDVKLNLVTSENVNPTLEEISGFSGEGAEPGKFDLSAIADANKNLTAAVLSPGDQVEVFEGEQTGMFGLVETVGSDVISLKVVGGEIHGQTVEVPARSVRKRFDVGEHVKVLSGKHTDLSGMVVEVKGDVVTVMADQGEQEIKVFSKDIRKAGEVAGGSAQVGLFDLHDLVMLDSATAAVIIKLEGSSLRVLDQNGTVRLVSGQQVTLRRENAKFAVAADSMGQDMKVGDAMKEVDGDGRKGEVINIFRSLFVFLHNRDLTENNGVFVARGTSLVSVTPRSATGDIGKMNPALNQQLPLGGASLMPPPMATVNKNRLVNTLVVVVKGTNKGLMGIIKDVMGDNARVELATNNKTLTINMTSLKRKDAKSGATFPLDTGGGYTAMGGYNGGGRPPAAGGYDVNPYSGVAMTPAQGGATPGNFGGRTPASRFGQTPNPYASGGVGGGKTPNPYASGAGAGGRTPGWAGSGGKTPGWGGGGGKTPGPVQGDGGRTPGWAAAGGGKTPNPYGAGPSGGRTPAPGSSMYSAAPPDPYGSRVSLSGVGESKAHEMVGMQYGHPVSAPTPYAVPPPGMMGAPTPGIMGAPTPGVIGAPTPAPPGMGGYSAPTPYGAPTPYSAPTPYAAPSHTHTAVHAAPTPGAGLGQHGAPTPYGSTPHGAPTPYGGATNGGHGATSSNAIPWDWALDFRNVIVEVGPSTRPGTRNPLHFQRGAVDGQRFGLEAVSGETVTCQMLSSSEEIVDIPAEYLRPCRPDGPGQMVIFLTGTSDQKGQQRTTAYLNDGQWMMESAPGDPMAYVMDEESLCRLWKKQL
ncbi:transcription elongation factor SPT5, partial [Tremellales sp. Uapishka_1]